VWRHEITRVIFDRLINEDDQALVHGHLTALLEVHYSEKMEYIMRDPILYGDYTNTLDPSEPRLYEGIEDLPTAHVSSSSSCGCTTLCVTQLYKLYSFYFCDIFWSVVI